MTLPNKALRQQIKDAIQNEPSEPQDTILQVLKENDGKKLTVHTQNKINERLGNNIDEYWKGVRIAKQYGMTHLVWGSSDEPAKSLLVAHNELNVVIEADKVEANNPAYFSAKDERNQRREAITEAQIANLARAAKELIAAKKRIEEILEYGETFTADRYTLLKVVGLSE